MRFVRVLDTFEGKSAFQEPRMERVVILQRDDGSFTIAHEYHFISEYEGEIIAQGWVRGDPYDSIYATVEIAESEGQELLGILKARSAGP